MLIFICDAPALSGKLNTQHFASSLLRMAVGRVPGYQAEELSLVEILRFDDMDNLPNRFVEFVVILMDGPLNAQCIQSIVQKWDPRIIHFQLGGEPPFAFADSGGNSIKLVMHHLVDVSDIWGLKF